jgi:hypothetical protein
MFSDYGFDAIRREFFIEKTAQSGIANLGVSSER